MTVDSVWSARRSFATLRMTEREFRMTERVLRMTVDSVWSARRSFATLRMTYYIV